MPFIRNKITIKHKNQGNTNNAVFIVTVIVIKGIIFISLFNSYIMIYRYFLFASLLFIFACKSIKSIPESDSNSLFSEIESELILSGHTDGPLRILKIDNTQDSVKLREKSKDITPSASNEELDIFIHRLYQTVTDSMSMGVGIAAPQVGVQKNIIWVQRFDKEGFPFEVYLNPKITNYTKLKQPCLEGCLSIPDRQDTTQTRAYAILLEYDKIDNTHHIEMIEDFTAVIFQHEIDHLNGILYLDHLEQEVRNAKK